MHVGLDSAPGAVRVALDGGPSHPGPGRDGDADDRHGRGGR